MTRTIAVLLAVVASICSFAAEMDFEPYREAVQVLLADEATPDVTLPDRLRERGLRKDPAWPGITGFGFTAPITNRIGYGVIDPATETVVGFTAAMPEPPVPMDVMEPDAAIAIARDFCSRHLPELLADGGEVRETVDEKVTIEISTSTAANRAILPFTTYHLRW